MNEYIFSSKLLTCLYPHAVVVPSGKRIGGTFYDAIIYMRTKSSLSIFFGTGRPLRRRKLHDVRLGFFFPASPSNAPTHASFFLWSNSF